MLVVKIPTKWEFDFICTIVNELRREGATNCLSGGQSHLGQGHGI